MRRSAGVSTTQRGEASRRGIGNERLPLRFVQAERAEEAACLSNLIVNCVEWIRTDGAARRRGGDLLQAVQALDFLNEIGLALEVHAPGRDAERGGVRVRIRDDRFADERGRVGTGVHEWHVRRAELQAETEQETFLVRDRN